MVKGFGATLAGAKCFDFHKKMWVFGSGSLTFSNIFNHFHQNFHFIRSSKRSFCPRMVSKVTLLDFVLGSSEVSEGVESHVLEVVWGLGAVSSGFQKQLSCGSANFGGFVVFGPY